MRLGGPPYVVPRPPMALRVSDHVPLMPRDVSLPVGESVRVVT